MNRKAFMEIQLTEEGISSLKDLLKIRNQENNLQRLRIEDELELTRLIRSGNYKAISIPSFEQIDPNVGILSLNKLQRYHDLTVSSIALATRIVISAGVLADDAHDLSDALLFALNNVHTADEIHRILELTFVLFTKQIYQVSHALQSPKTKQAQTYITRHIYGNITIAEIANHVSLSESRLQHLFKKDMGVSIKDYILQSKIQTACNLLRFSDLTIVKISDALGFSSQSHFSTTFKKITGLRPSEYRSQTYNEVF